MPFSIQKPSQKHQMNFCRLTIQEPIFLCPMQNLKAVFDTVAMGMATAIALFHSPAAPRKKNGARAGVSFILRPMLYLVWWWWW
jgi:hypothetical protein